MEREAGEEKRGALTIANQSALRKALLKCNQRSITIIIVIIIIKNTPSCPPGFFCYTLIVTDGNHKRMPCAGLKTNTYRYIQHHSVPAKTK